MIESKVPRATPRGEEKAFFDGAVNEQLLIQVCRDCGDLSAYRRTVCHGCGGLNVTERPAIGTGSIYSYSIQYRAPHPCFSARVPYIVVLVDLDDGVRVLSELVECEASAVRVGLPVQVVFDHVDVAYTIPRFRPAPDSEEWM